MNELAFADRLRSATSLTDGLEVICAAQGDRAAVMFDGFSITYRELGARASCIASGLQARGVRPGDLVGLFCERSLDLVVAMFGIWKAGAAYLPIDPGYPATRVRHILENASPVLVVVDEQTASVASSSDLPNVPLSELLRSADEVAPRKCSPSDLAYVIYTSGSTGVPKGVAVTHGNVLHMLTQTEPWFRFNENDVWTMFHSAAFDFSVFEIWGCLLFGGRLVVVPYRTSRVADEFRDLLQREGVTVLCQTPSAFQMLVAADAGKDDRLNALRTVVFGGEALNFRSLLPWFDRYADDAPELVNMYGITEITVHATYRRVLRHDAETVAESLIGVPIPGSAIYLVDEHLHPAEEGEMLIAGPGVAVGYLGMPERTAERFLPNPFGEGRVYRSGDLARRKADGDLIYLGRADRQVKVQGFRIEPAEIEAALLRHPAVRHVHVCAVAHPVAGTSLAAYIVTDEEQLDATALATFSAEQLPPQMRPAYFLRLDALPLTVNGKIDRDALPSPFAGETPLQQAHSGELHETVARAWQTVLCTGTAPPDDMNFFEAGGNSLLLIALQAELARVLDRPIPAVWLFQFPSIASFTQKLSAGTALNPDTVPDISRAATTRPAKPAPFRSFRQRKELSQ